MRRIFARRAVLKAAAAGLLSFPAAVRLRAEQIPPASPAEPQPGWSFEDVTGPEHWSELSPDYALCQFGIEQSPIDLVDAAKVSFSRALRLDYRPVTVRVTRMTWTVQVAFDPGCSIMTTGRRYALEFMHIRHPSEHLLSGRALEMELQLTHRSEDGALAMIGVFVRQGKQHEALERIIADLPSEVSGQPAVLAINPVDLLPPPQAEGADARPFYRYMGSLTTPPCTEGVNWTVFKTPIEASAKQIRELAALFPANARPANKINRRFLLEYGG
jgi:carbonic anhydrase